MSKTTITTRVEGIDEFILKEIMSKEGNLHKHNNSNLMLEALRTYYDLKKKNNWRR